MYNDLLASGTFPSHFKDSLVIPLLKKPSLDSDNLKNYRPVSNFSFISKVLERIVYFQFLNYITANKLIDKFQSAYKPGHSTETALIRVVNDMSNAMDNGILSLLTLLDLSAVFDTIDHSILLESLQTSFGIDGLPLKWVKSYLSNKHQKVKLITTFLMYFQFCVAFLWVQFLGLYSSTFILLLMLSMTTNFFIMYMLMTSNCIAFLLPIKLIHFLTKFLHQPMTSTYGCQQTNLK